MTRMPTALLDLPPGTRVVGEALRLVLLRRFLRRLLIPRLLLNREALWLRRLLLSLLLRRCRRGWMEQTRNTLF